MRRKFCCDDSRDMYADYYVRQSESGISAFSGARVQRGHGLGSLLSSLWRSALPLLRKGLSWFGKKALDTGATIAGNVARDVAEGKSFTDATKSRVLETINEYAGEGEQQTGSGGRRRRRSAKVQKRKRSESIKQKSKKVKRDVFD